MSVRSLSRRTEPIHRTFVAACQASWAAAPVVVVTSVVWTLAALPLVAAQIVALPMTTGVFRVWAAIANGDPIRWRQLTTIDPGLALVVWCLALAIRLLLTVGDVGVLAASTVGAVSVLVIPLAFAYGAVRDRNGRAAVRGGLVLATLRPDLAVTLGAMVVLAGFAIVVSAGALVLCVPALVAVFACRAVATDLQRLGIAGVGGPSVSDSFVFEGQP